MGLGEGGRGVEVGTSRQRILLTRPLTGTYPLVIKKRQRGTGCYYEDQRYPARSSYRFAGKCVVLIRTPDGRNGVGGLLWPNGYAMAMARTH